MHNGAVLMSRRQPLPSWHNGPPTQTAATDLPVHESHVLCCRMYSLLIPPGMEWPEGRPLDAGPRSAIRIAVYNPYGSFTRPDPFNTQLGFDLHLAGDADWSDEETTVPGAERAPPEVVAAGTAATPLLAALATGAYKPWLWSDVVAQREAAAEVRRSTCRAVSRDVCIVVVEDGQSRWPSCAR